MNQFKTSASTTEMKLNKLKLRHEPWTIYLFNKKGEHFMDLPLPGYTYGDYNMATKLPWHCNSTFICPCYLFVNEHSNGSYI